MPPRRSTRASASVAPATAPAPASRSRGASKASTPISEDKDSIVDSDSEEDSIVGSSDAPSDVEEDVKPVKKAPVKKVPVRKAAPVRKSTRKPSITPTEPEVDEVPEPASELESEEDVPIREGIRKTAGKLPNKAVPKASAKRVIAESDSEEDEVDANVAPSTPEKKPVPSTPPAVAEESSEDEPNDDDTVRLLPSTPARGSMAKPMATPSHAQYLAQQKMETEKERERERIEKESKEPKKRLVIHKLVLVDFKSYAGRQEIGPFHKSFSAIVGPNGSGKSNTIDALLFVFGYRASKMRQGKLSELIHNSAGREGLETCSVEVWFREIIDLPGADAFTIVPNSQLVVSRTAFRNNSSKYSINDRTSSFTEVTTLLKGRGIDLDHKRFLILQGEVESIAQMKPKAQTEHEDGLLEYLEDIIGTSKYKEPIEQAQVEVDELNDQRGEKMNRLRLVEKEKSALENKKREAEDFLRNANELTRKKSLLWQFHMYTLQNNLEITSKAIEGLTAELAREQEKNASHLAEVDELQRGYDDKLTGFEDMKRLTDALVKDSKKFEKEEVGLVEKKKHLSTKQKKLKKSLADDSHARSEALSWVTSHGEELDRSRNKIDELEHKLVKDEADLDVIRDGLKDKTDQFTTKIEAAQRELEPWTAKISEKQSAIDVATSERDLLAQKATGAQSSLEEAATSLEKLKETDAAKRSEHSDLKKERITLQKQLATAERNAETMTTKAEALRSKVSVSRAKADEAKASMAANRSENAVLSSLTKLKQQGRVKGFHGRLGDLGTIDDKYDVAITTACGALNNLVVDTVEQGQGCIEHLRRGNVGRASFMVLEKLPQRDLSPIETPENVPRLFDLIKPREAKFAPAFYKAIMNTLVADNLEQAQRIGFGKKRWRVVTLAGQLIDPSGTMSGGGARVSRGGMSSKFAGEKVEPDVLARYEKESVTAQEDLQAFHGEKRAIDAEVDQLQKRIPEVDMAIEKIELDIQTSTKRIADAQRRLEELGSQSKPDAGDEKRIVQLEREIATATKEVDSLRAKAAIINDQIKELQNKILEVGGVQLRAMQSKVTTTKGLIDNCNETITKAEVAQAKAQRDAEKLEKVIAANTTKLEEAEAELETVNGDLQACSGDLEVIKAKVQEALDAVETVQEALAASKAELDEKLQFINEFRAIEMEIKQKIDDNARVQKDSKDKLKHWTKRHAELELVEVDEEDEDEEEESAAVKAEPDSNAMDEDAEQVPAKSKPKRDLHELAEYSPDELQAVKKDFLNGEITQLEEEVAKAKPNLNVLAEYRKRESEFLDRARDIEAVTASRDNAKQRYDDLRKARLDEFMAGFSAISSKLKEMYQMITLGGNAELELVDSIDPFSEGVNFSVMPPKKSWKQIGNLSGGEKTLASLALVFALHVFKPTPLYFMDEIDAALDFRNVSIIANYIRSKTDAAQFIIISLRNDMFELAHRLVGIYKTSNCTKSIAIDNKELRTQGVAKRPTTVPATPQVAKTPRVIAV